MTTEGENTERIEPHDKKKDHRLIESNKLFKFDTLLIESDEPGA